MFAADNHTFQLKCPLPTITGSSLGEDEDEEEGEEEEEEEEEEGCRSTSVCLHPMYI